MNVEQHGQAGLPRLSAYVHLGRGANVPEHVARYLRGDTNDLTPYGFHLARDAGVTVIFSSDFDITAGSVAARRNRWGNRLLRFDFFHALANRRAIAACDVVWTMTESEAFAVAALMTLRMVPRKPIIGNAVWLFNRWKTLPEINRRLFRILSPYISIMTVHSRECIAVAQLALPGVPCELTYFGISADVYPMTPPVRKDGTGPIRVLAAGNDATRDWATFLAALGNDERFLLKAWTPSIGAEQGRQYGNLVLPKPTMMSDIMAMYRECDVVVIPMVDNVFSGITVALEAVALGRPVICSNTGGVPTYFNDDEVSYVPPGDPIALREAVLRVSSPETLAKARAAQATFARNEYTTRAMIDRYIKLTWRYLDAGSFTLDS